MVSQEDREAARQARITQWTDKLKRQFPLKIYPGLSERAYENTIRQKVDAAIEEENRLEGVRKREATRVKRDSAIPINRQYIQRLFVPTGDNFQHHGAGFNPDFNKNRRTGLSSSETRPGYDPRKRPRRPS